MVEQPFHYVFCISRVDPVTRKQELSYHTFSDSRCLRAKIEREIAVLEQHRRNTGAFVTRVWLAQTGRNPVEQAAIYDKERKEGPYPELDCP